MFSKSCEMCGKEFGTNRVDRKYCGDMADKNSCKSKNRLLKGWGRLKQKWGHLNGWDIAKSKVLERDGWKCLECGLHTDVPSFLEIHHRDGNRKNNMLGNLETLCPNCHRWKTIAQRVFFKNQQTRDPKSISTLSRTA